MLCWKATVLPALKRQHSALGVPTFYVVEDGVLLLPDVTFADVSVATKHYEASLWGYGNYAKDALTGSINWHGAKGLCVTYPWCQKLAFILENTPLDACGHLDLWLGRSNKQKPPQPGIVLVEPLAGYGHRVSDTSTRGPVFGGAWLPPPSGSLGFWGSLPTAEPQH